MNFEEFAKEAAEKIKDYLPEKYADSEVELQSVQKNNEAVTGLLITSPEFNLCPNIYLESFFEAYEAGKDMSAILEEIAAVRIAHEAERPFDVTDIVDYEKAKGKIVPRVVGLEGNEEMLKNRPYQQMADLAVTYSILLGEDKNGAMSAVVSNSLMEGWGVTQEEIHKAALFNMDYLTPATITPMHEIMREIMLPSLIEECDGDLERADMMLALAIPPEEMMYVVTNEQKTNGAAVFLSENAMDMIAGEVGKDFYILPSSIHELIVVPDNGAIDLAQLEDMVRDVNATQVAPMDRLSDHVYRYDYDTRGIFRADLTDAHEKEKLSLELPKDAIADQARSEVKKPEREERTSLKNRLSEKQAETKEKEKKPKEKDLSKAKEHSL